MRISQSPFTLPVASGLLLASCAAMAVNPFLPHEPETQSPEPMVTKPAQHMLPQRPGPQGEVRANAQYMGTINGISVYVDSSTGCYIYYEDGHLRRNTCLTVVRQRMHDDSADTAGD